MAIRGERLTRWITKAADVARDRVGQGVPAGDWILIAVAVVLVVLLWLQNRPRKRPQPPGLFGPRG